MTFIENLVGEANNILWSYVLIIVLIGLGLYFTIRTKLVQFINIPEMFRVIFDKRSINASGKKGTSSFQAFAISAASRVGTGNLAGVKISCCHWWPWSNILDVGHCLIRSGIRLCRKYVSSSI